MNVNYYRYSTENELLSIQNKKNVIRNRNKYNIYDSSDSLIVLNPRVN